MEKDNLYIEINFNAIEYKPFQSYMPLISGTLITGSRYLTLFIHFYLLVISLLRQEKVLK